MFEGRNFSHFHRQSFSQGEWKALGDLGEDRDIVIESADKGSRVIIWEREDYLKETDRQFSGSKIYTDVNYTKNMLSSPLDKSNKIFQSLSKKKYISEKELKYFTCNSKNATNLEKFFT